MVRLTKKKNNANTNTNAKKRGILRLLRSPGRYIKHKISIYKKLVKKEPKKPC